MKTKLHISLFVLFLLFICISIGFTTGAIGFAGRIAYADKKLNVGDVYECITPLIRVVRNNRHNDDGYQWYAIVKVENKHYGLKFNREVPLKGVVAEQDGTVVFIRIAAAEEVTISNPLPAENSAE